MSEERVTDEREYNYSNEESEGVLCVILSVLAGAYEGDTGVCKQMSLYIIIVIVLGKQHGESRRGWGAPTIGWCIKN